MHAACGVQDTENLSMMIRFFRMGRALLAVLPLFAFWLPGTAAGLTFHEALRLADQHAPSLNTEAARVQAVRSEAIVAGELPDRNCCLAYRACPSRGPSAGASTTMA